MVRPTVALFAKPDGLSIRLVEGLLSNSCFIKILSEEKEAWEENLSHVSQKNLFQIVDTKKQKESATFEYLILLNQTLAFSEGQILDICRFAAAQSAKTLITLPFVTETSKSWQESETLRSKILRKIPEAGIIYTGDIFGPRYFAENKNSLMASLTDAVIRGEVKGDTDAVFYPIYTESLVKYLTRSIFSFGPYGRETSLYSEAVTSPDLINLFSKVIAREIVVKKKILERKEVLGVKKEVYKSDLEKNLYDTAVYISRNVGGEGRSVVLPKRAEKTKQHFLRKGILIGIVSLFIMPFLLMAVGAKR